MRCILRFKIVAIIVLIWASLVVADGQSARNTADLIVSRGIVVTMDDTRRVIDDGAVAVKDDSIVAVGPRAEIETKYKSPQTIDAKGGLILPEFINGHTHVPMTLFRGLHDDVTLNEWLYKYIFPAEAKNVNEDFVRWGTRLAAAEQIRAGVTTFADTYYFEDVVAEETKKAGMRGVLGRRSSIFLHRTIKTKRRCWHIPRNSCRNGKVIP
jgi:5-methylthioadenosine/S-adenosylhomocysteine deaminase